MNEHQLSLFKEENEKKPKKEFLEKEYLKTNDGVVFCSEKEFLEESLSNQILYYDDLTPRIVSIDPERESEDILYIAIASSQDFTLKEIKQKYPERFFMIQKVKEEELANPEDNIKILDKLKDSVKVKSFLNKKNIYDIEKELENDIKNSKNKPRF